MNFARRHTTPGPTRIPRLPLVAFIDVILFLLIYFTYIADLSPQESHLPAALRTDSPGQGQGGVLLPQVLLVESHKGSARFRMGDRIMDTRASLDALLRSLPTSAGIVVKVHPEASVEAAAAALASARNAGFTRISYVPVR
jgi:biopolymer transport protein ExbD